MEEGFWRWQRGASSELFAVTVLSDGSPVVAGAEWGDSEGWEFLAIKLDPANEAIAWEWKNGSGAHDVVKGVAPGANGSVILTGYTYIDGHGGTQANETCYEIMLDSDGNFMWQWQSDWDQDDWGNAVWNMGVDSVVVPGRTEGIWEGTNEDSSDFSAVKPHVGVEPWTWKDPRRLGSVKSVLRTEDDSVVLCGKTRKFPLGTDGRASNVATVIKMDANGRELWSWQGDGSGISSVSALVMGRHGIVVLGGCETSSRRSSTSGCDFSLVELSAIDGRLVRGPWQASTSEGDEIHAMAALYDTSIILAGSTHGLSASSHDDDGQDFPEGVVVMLSTRAGFGTHSRGRRLMGHRPTQDPTPSPTPSVALPTDQPTTMPTAPTPPARSPETEISTSSPPQSLDDSPQSPMPYSNSQPPTIISSDSDSNSTLSTSMTPDSYSRSPASVSTNSNSSMKLLIPSLLVSFCVFGIIATGIIVKRLWRQTQDANDGYPDSTSAAAQRRGGPGSRTLEPAPPLTTAIILAPATASAPGHKGPTKGGRVQSVAVDSVVVASVEDNSSFASGIPASHPRESAGASREPPSYSRPVSGGASIAIATPAVGNEGRYLRTVNVSRVSQPAPSPMVLPR